MNAREDQEKEARRCRALANRARQFVLAIGSDADRIYLRFAEVQEQRAVEVEAAMRRTGTGANFQAEFCQSQPRSPIAQFADDGRRTGGA